MRAWNDSLRGDYLWTSTNVGEALPGVMTPLTWSFIRHFIGEALFGLSVAGHPLCGNIGGRGYFNVSVMDSLGAALGMRRRMGRVAEQVFGRIPPGLEIPLLPVSRWRLLREIFPLMLRVHRSMKACRRRLGAFLAGAPERCERLRAQIDAVPDAAGLISLWGAEITPFLLESARMLRAATRQGGNAIIRIRLELQKKAGEADAEVLLTERHAAEPHLPSLGLVVGLGQLSSGEIDRATFARLYGHRGPWELEVSVPRPAEDPEWIDRQLAGIRHVPETPAALLLRQEAARQAAWERLRRRRPRDVDGLRRKVERWRAVAHDREAVRSELVRAQWVLRAWALGAGKLAGLGDDVFFLEVEEILAVLGGDRASLAAISSRRATYERHRALPAFPPWIRGRFDPFQWAQDPDRRGDVFDATAARPAPSGVIRGIGGAAGVVEGVVRVVLEEGEGDALRPGEILVAAVTNVGWTPLFPRAAAVVTDVGASLSHAAIVARELGIPAVVGCGDATSRLRTGDRVRVDGAQGLVEVVERTAGA